MVEQLSGTLWYCMDWWVWSFMNWSHYNPCLVLKSLWLGLRKGPISCKMHFQADTTQKLQGPLLDWFIWTSGLLMNKFKVRESCPTHWLLEMKHETADFQLGGYVPCPTENGWGMKLIVSLNVQKLSVIEKFFWKMWAFSLIHSRLSHSHQDTCILRFGDYFLCE